MRELEPGSKVTGVDEAGRGPLAGPVVAVACSFPVGVTVAGVTDSKKLSPKLRSALYEELISHPDIDYGVGIVDALVIDQINVLQATFQAMVAAVGALKQAPGRLLVDGPHLPDFALPAEAVVGGDALYFAISAASIIAKETRDRLMLDYDAKWPLYGFARHKGYGTLQHLVAIAEHGPCPIHRLSFRPFSTL